MTTFYLVKRGEPTYKPVDEKKHTKYQKIIVVSHGMLIRTIRDQAEIAHAEIIEYCTE